MYKIIYRSDWHGQVAKKLHAYVVSQGVEARLIRRSWFASCGKKFEIKKIIYVENEDGTYFIIDFKDLLKDDFIIRDVVHDDKCVKILKSQYRSDHYNKPPYDKIVPYTYFEKNPELMQALRKNPVTKTKKKMFFRGRTWQNRDKILHFIADIITPNIKTPILDYYLDCQKHWIGLALPGYGNFCHRELEYFGLGVVAIMPKLKNSFHDDLRPGYHYVSIDVNTTKDEPNVIADGIRAAYEGIKDNEEKLCDIVINAKRWYDRNVKFPNSVKLAARLLGMCPGIL